MIITKVVLKDYGAYGGRHEFDLAPARGRPVILIGGANGAGKTTLFEAVPLCFYGIASTGRRTTKKAYERLLAMRLHHCRKSRTAADHASVTVRFRFFHNSRETEYEVERSWRSEHGRIAERLDVKKRDGGGGHGAFEPLDVIEESYWQSFIGDLIPRGIVRLFFFNGEKIARMAREGAEDATIRASFKSLLGIEVAEQLHADLQTNMMRNLSEDDKILREDLSKCEASRDEAARTVERLHERLAQKQTEADAIRAEIDGAESAISKLGGEFASGRADARTRLEVKRAQHGEICRKIRDVCSDALPLALIPEDLSSLSGQIDADRYAAQERAGGKIADGRLDSVLSRFGEAALDGTGISTKQRRAINSALSSIIRDEKKKSLPPPGQVFDFSESQAAAVKGMVGRVGAILLPALAEETARLVDADREIAVLEEVLARAPRDDEIGSLVSKVGELHSQYGELRAEMNHIEEKISSNRALQNHLDSKMRGLLSEARKNKKSREQIDLARSVQTVLEEFIGGLRTKKIRLLEQYLLDAAGTLMHKKHLIEKVRIDPKTFEITLYGGGDNDSRSSNAILPKDLLSEGEKQMFATSVLWALARTSGRPLPFMIDTPLARLDQSHRTNLVERFLPAASHQILILSTDTEIERWEQQKLKPYTARSYIITNDGDDGTARCRRGYFWDDDGTGREGKAAAV